jgi:protein subunit release factor B
MNFPIEIHEKFMKMAVEVGLKPEDVDEKFTHGHGHGGQKVNKSANCVELTHHPSGITVRFQHHRGLHQNRKEAWELLILKVEEHHKGEESQLAHERFKIRRQKQRRTRRSKEKVLKEKHERSEIKENRAKTIGENETTIS